MLGPLSGLSEVLWIFSRLEDKNKRLAVKQNPHFYIGLPTLPETYGGKFRMNPIETFQHLQHFQLKRINVLIDNPDRAGRVFLETAGKVRVFDNVWVLNDTIIFKGLCLLCFSFPLSDTLLDVCGNLEGESVVEETIQGIPNLWCFEESLSLAPQPASSPNRNSPSLTDVAATQISSATGILIGNWKEPIRRMLQSRDVIIRITDKPPSSSSSTHSAAASQSHQLALVAVSAVMLP
jgi:hypothetical protein